MSSAFAVPVIDLERFRLGTAADRDDVAAEVDEAARSVGFLQVVGHAIPADVEAGLTAAMDGFFGLPMWQKKALRPGMTDLRRGYTPPRDERFGAAPGPGDLFEAFDVGRSAEEFPGLALDDVQYAPNLWPLRPDGFEPAVTEWFFEAARVAREVMRVAAVALGLDEWFFTGYQDHAPDVLRILNYRPSAPGRPAMGAHTDQGIVTVLWADPVPGLQVGDVAGEWHDVVRAPGALLVNPGDLLARWTDGRWRSAPHRVLPPTGPDGSPVPRRSAVFFHDLHGSLPELTRRTDPRGADRRR